MNMVYVSICLSLPIFLSSLLCSFLNTGFWPPWLDAFLGILFFLLLYQMGFSPLISVSDISLFVYKNDFDFWILTLYPTVLPNSFIRLSSFLVESIGFSMYTIMSSGNNDSFASSSPIWMPFISFSCLTVVARTFNTMLNKSSERGQPCLVPDLRGKVFHFCLLNMRLAIGLSCMAFIRLRNIPFSPTLLSVFFYHK